MLRNITDVMNNVNTNELDVFMANTKAMLKFTSDSKETKIDYSWLSEKVSKLKIKKL